MENEHDTDSLRRNQGVTIIPSRHTNVDGLGIELFAEGIARGANLGMIRKKKNYAELARDKGRRFA